MADHSEVSSVGDVPNEVIDTATEPPQKKLKRKKKDLPPELANMSPKHKNRIVIARTTLDKEIVDFTVGQEYDVAVSVKGEDNKTSFDLEKLNLDQLRDFAKNMKVLSSSKMNKFQCKHAIALVVQRDPPSNSGNADVLVGKTIRLTRPSVKSRRQSFSSLTDKLHKSMHEIVNHMEQISKSMEHNLMLDEFECLQRMMNRVQPGTERYKKYKKNMEELEKKLFLH